MIWAYALSYIRIYSSDISKTVYLSSEVMPREGHWATVVFLQPAWPKCYVYTLPYLFCKDQRLDQSNVCLMLLSVFYKSQ